MTNKQKMLNGELYLASDKELTAMKKNANNLFDKINNSKMNDHKIRKRYFKKLLGTIGNDYNINKPFYCDYGVNIHIGNNFYANFNTTMLDVAEIRIGNNVMFGPNVNIYTAGHPIDPDVRNSQLEFGKKVTIGNNVWVGGSVVINPGVTIGNNVVIASGSVVTKSFNDNVIIGGNPAKILRKIDENDKSYWENKKKQYFETIENERGNEI